MSIGSLETIPTSIAYYSGLHTFQKEIFPYFKPSARMHQSLDIQETLSLERTGDHATTSEDRSASRQAYCFAVMRGRDLLLSLEDNGALVTSEISPFSMVISFLSTSQKNKV
jgi:hypothetical protein